MWRQRASWVVAVSVVATGSVVVGPPLAVRAVGELDPSFSGDGTARIAVSDDFSLLPGGGGVVLPDGAILVGGVDSAVGFELARLSATGDRDLSFGDGGVAVADVPGAVLSALLPSSDGNVVAVGSGVASVEMARFTGGGALDSSFGGGDGRVSVGTGSPLFGETFRVVDGVIVPDDHVMVASVEAYPPWYPATAHFARFNPDGGLDTTFGGDGWVAAVVPRPAGQTVQVCAGAMSAAGETVLVGVVESTRSLYLGRFTADGAPDPSFGGGGGYTVIPAVTVNEACSGAGPYPVRLLSDGQIVIAVNDVVPLSADISDDVLKAVVRLSPLGILDTSFGGGDGIATVAAEPAYDLAVGDDYIYLPGVVYDDVGFDHMAVTRLNAAGALEATFGEGGTATFGLLGSATSVATQLDGKPVIFGATYETSGAPNYDTFNPGVGVVRLLADEVAEGTARIAVATNPPGGSGTVTVGAPMGGVLGGGAQTARVAVTPGQVVVDVTASTGWAISDVICDDTDSGADTAGRVAFQVATGEDVSCVIVIAENVADVSITKSAQQGQVVAGGTLRYSLTASNAGPATAADVEMVDMLPASVRFVSASPGCVHNGPTTGGEVVCAVGTIRPGELATATVEVTAGSSGVLTNNAAVSASSVDPQLGNNLAAAVTTTVLPAQSNPCQTGPGNELWAFGDNTWGSMAVLRPGIVSTAAPVNLMRDVRQVSGETYAGHAVLENGTVCSWGSNQWGSLGRPVGPSVPGFGSYDPIPAPVLTPTGSRLTASRVIAADGTGAFAIVDDDGDGAGTLVGWGENTYGTVRPGGPTRLLRATPLPLPGGGEVIDVYSGNAVTLAVSEDGRVFSWGVDSWSGQIDILGPVPGDQTGTATIDLTPYLPLLPGEHPARGFVYYSHHIVVVTDQGRGLCYTAAAAPSADPRCNNGFGVLFDAPGEVIAIDGSAVSIAMIVDDDGDGVGDVHVLGSYPGDGSPGSLYSFSRALIGEPLTQIAVGRGQLIALGQSGRVWGWGTAATASLGGGGIKGEVLSPILLEIEHADLVEAASRSTFVRGDPITNQRQSEAINLSLARGASGGLDGEGDGATVADRVETTITNSNSTSVGSNLVRVFEESIDPGDQLNVTGYQMWGEVVRLSATRSVAPAASPFTVQFALFMTPAQRAVQTTFGGFVERMAVFRNGASVGDCTNATPPFTPDPCVRSRVFNAMTGNAVITVTTTRFSTWTFAAPAPVVDAGGPYQAMEGTPVQLVGTVTNVGAGSIVTRWSDSIGAVSDPAALNPTFVAPDDGATTLLLEAEVADQTGTDEAVVNVTNAPPAITDVTTTPSTPRLGDTVQASLTFTDPGFLDTHTVTVDWGDTSPVTVLSSTRHGGATMSASHAYLAAGAHVLAVTVTDDDGGVATRSVTVNVAGYQFNGFYEPVNSAPTYNRMNAGRAIPVTFSIGGNFGMEILATGSPTSRQVSCITGAPTDTVETTVAAGGSSLSYDIITSRYSYIWKTDKAWAGQCRQFVLTLNDGTAHTALFTFK